MPIVIVINKLRDIGCRESSREKENTGKYKDLIRCSCFLGKWSLMQGKEQLNFHASKAFRQKSPPLTGDFRKVSLELSASKSALAIHRRASREASRSPLYDAESDRRDEKFSGNARNSEPEGSRPRDLMARKALAASEGQR